MVGQIGRPLLIGGVYSFNSAIPLILLTSSSEESIASRVLSDHGLEAQQATEVIWARSSTKESIQQQEHLCLASCLAVYFFGEIQTFELLLQFNPENRSSSMSCCTEVQRVSLSICINYLSLFQCFTMLNFSFRWPCKLSVPQPHETNS